MLQRDMKTVIMLDRSAKFADKCNETFDFTIREGPKQKKLQVDKTIWTWCLEGIFEMHRILSDVYPRGSLQLRFALADFMGKMLDSEWKETFLVREDLAKILKTVKRPATTKEEVSLLGGLTMAIEALAVESPEQKEYNYNVRFNLNKRSSTNSEVIRARNELKGVPPLPSCQNNGNLIIYTRYKTEEEIVNLKNEVVTLINSRNKIANTPSNKTFHEITSIRMFIVNYYAAGDECTVKTHPLEPHPDLPLLKTWVISRKAIDMNIAIHSLLIAAFDLGSTTVTKIPMKEDNRNSSNYDVELFHSGKVHSMLRKQKLMESESKNSRKNEGPTYDTMRLTWTTAPKTKWSLFPYHGVAAPCTTAQAYSRPSACLTQFVRDGRCVMLDSEKTEKFGMNMPNKCVSHLLNANRGRIFIQEVDFMQKKRRVIGNLRTSRRVRAPQEPLNLGQLKHTFKQMELKIVAKNRMRDELTEEEEKRWNALKNADIEKRLSCITKNIPMYAKDTFIFNELVKKHLEPLITAPTKLTLNQSDVDDCHKSVIRLLQMRNQRDLIVPADLKIGPCSVKNLSDPAEQMRVAIVELAKHIGKYAIYSNEHKFVYKTFMEATGADQLLNVNIEDDESIKKMFVSFPFFGRNQETKIVKSDSEDDDDDELESFFSNHEELINKEVEFNEEVTRGKRKKEEEIPEKPIVMAKSIKLDIFASLCEKLQEKEEKIRREFVGRELHGNKAPLYPQLAEKLERSASPSGDRTEKSERTERSDKVERSERPERTDRTERVRTADRAGSGTPPPIRRPFN